MHYIYKCTYLLSLSILVFGLSICLLKSVLIVLSPTAYTLQFRPAWPSCINLIVYAY